MTVRPIGVVFIVFFVLVLSGMFSSCNIYIVKLKHDEKLVVAKNGEQKNNDQSGGGEDENTDRVENESSYFGPERDIMAMRSGTNPTSSSFFKYNIVPTIGFTRIYGDLHDSKLAAVYGLAINRHLKKYLTLGIMMRHGIFSSYENRNNWTDGLQTDNEFTSASINMRVFMGAFNKNGSGGVLNGLYAGIGAGVIFSDVSNISTKFKQKDPKLISQIFPSSINTNTSSFYIPFDLGINIKLSKRFFVNGNCRFGYSFTDDLDGYNFQGGVKNKYSDMFSILSVGIGYRFVR